MNAQNNTPVYDVGIIGGGIAGAAIARDASLRGLNTVLFEKNTFGSGTSSKSSKLIHGGIRYLEVSWDCLKKGNFHGFTKNLLFVWSSLRECQILSNIAPNIIKPLVLVIPFTKDARRHRISVIFGALLYSLMALLAGHRRLPKIFWTKNSMLRHTPQLNKDKTLGGILIWDHTADDLTLTRSIVDSAAQKGCVALENAEVLNYHYLNNTNKYEIKVRHEQTLKTFQCKKLINATGAWIDQVKDSSENSLPRLIEPIAGCHLEFKKFLETSVILLAKDGRIFFVIVRGNACRVGTTERKCTTPDHVDATTEEKNYLLESLNNYFPDLHLSHKDILSSDAGIRPLALDIKIDSVHKISREHKITVSPSGVLHVAGVKLTDHRRAAEEVVNKICKRHSTTKKALL